MKIIMARAKSAYKIGSIFTFVSVLMCANGVFVEVQSSCKLWIQGDSTLHGFTSTATQVTAVLHTETNGKSSSESALPLRERILSGKAGRLELTIPVRSLKSGESQMDKNMYNTLKEKEYPVITFTLSEYEVGKTTGSSLPVKAKGRLSITGAERDIELHAKGQLSSKGLSVTGEQEVLMTDYQIVPPKLMMGMLKVANRIVVHYHLLVPWVEAPVSK